jgi:hypothetical protein
MSDMMKKEIFDEASSVKISEQVSRDKNGVYRYKEGKVKWHFLSLKQLNLFLETLEGLDDAKRNKDSGT